MWPQAQGRAGIHQGTSATCSCSFFVPSPVLQLHSDSKLARMKGLVFTRKRVHGESTANLSVPTGPYLPIWDTPATRHMWVMPTHSKDMGQMC